MASSRRGFVLLTAAAAMIGLLLVVGLGMDVGRLYVARSELQIYTDEAAIAAAFELDGTAAGLTRARPLVRETALPRIARTSARPA
jgi:uncharacterized membrane protein